MEASVEWKNGMAFNANLNGFDFMIDGDEKFGGQGLGPRPKGLTLVSLAGCTAMDVISILRKMKVEGGIDSFKIATDGQLAEEHPKKITEIVVDYIFQGEKLQASIDKIKKAIQLSVENYCGVYATLQPTVKISHRLFVNHKEIT